MKRLRIFETAELAAAILPTLEYSTLSKIRGESGVSLNLGVVPPAPCPESTPFYIDVRGPVTLAATSGLQMSNDGKTWTDTTAMTLPTGKTYFRVASDQSTPLKPNWTEDSNSDYDIGGNINSLVMVNFENDTTSYSFNTFFQNKGWLKNAGDLILPATTLVENCYSSMFSNCPSLTAAPVLPATTLANGCYNMMFYACKALTAAPVLPATTLAINCYASMFQNCTSLTAAPVLPATTLAANCYKYMFSGCKALTTAPATLPATTLANGCYRNMFTNCTFLTTAPELPATTLVNTCYQEMFESCTYLNYIKCLATNISATDCTRSWTSGVAATGTFVKAVSMSSWPTSGKGIPSGWTVQDAV